MDTEQHKDDWRDQCIRSMQSRIEGGLAIKSCYRDLDWGIPVPVDGGEGKAFYAWFDAPIGYVSATKQWAIDNETD